MPLETGTFLSDLVASNPVGSDNKSTADDHLRLIKSTLKASFPVVAGAVTKTHLELNAAHDQRVPVGGIIMWSGSQASIPAGWLLCNGLSGTPDLRGRFLIGAGGAYAVAATGGAEAHVLTSAELASHSHGVTDPSHSHGIIDPSHTHALTATTSQTVTGGAAASLQSVGTGSTGASNTGITINASSTGITVQSAGSGQAHNNMPPYYALCFIQKSA